ncbi:ferritin-like domain-containing protein [Micrococcaceae bacterium Sec5.7]
MATWCVVNDDSRENRRPGRYFRYSTLLFIAVLVVSLGVALIPREAPSPAVPPFSEQARAAAFTETMGLRVAGRQLMDSASGAERLHFARTVTLLTTQARALILPGETDTPRPDRVAASGAHASNETVPVPPSASGLVAALATSGGQRLADAETADGGMARLLAAIGAAQLVQAAALAAASGIPAPAAPVRDIPAVAGSCPAPAPAPAGASLEAALSVAVKTEVETVYGYQVALTRLDGAAAASASGLLARHENMVDEAEAQSRVHCVAIPPREPGYTLGDLFLAAPATGLGSLESGTLPVYGDLVALSEGSTRTWAISGLLNAAQRAVQWGADPGPVPGVVLDTAQLPPLPENNASATVNASNPPAP